MIKNKKPITNLILENHHKQDIPEKMQKKLETRFIENRELWLHFHEAFWPENKGESLKRFLSLTTGSNIVAQTVFVDFGQLELMAETLLLLKEKKIKINVYLSCGGLHRQIIKYLEKNESDITPNSEEYDNSYELREAFKKEMNKKVYIAISYHKIYDMDYWDYDENGKIIDIIDKRVTRKSLKTHKKFHID